MCVCVCVYFRVLQGKPLLERQSLCGGQGCWSKTGKTQWMKNREVKETNMAMEGG